jgi:hypothetical protein
MKLNSEMCERLIAADSRELLKLTLFETRRGDNLAPAGAKVYIAPGLWRSP